MLFGINGRKKVGQAMSHSIVQSLACSTTTSYTNANANEQFQAAYTNAKFREAKEELRRKSYCYPTLLGVHGTVQTFTVSEDIGFGGDRKDITFCVWWDEMSCDFRV